MRKLCVSVCWSTSRASGIPSAPPARSTVLPCQFIFRRSTTRLVACTTMLQIIMNGTASAGGRTWSSSAPATAEKAKPAKPETRAPAKTPRLRIMSAARLSMAPLAEAPVQDEPVLASGCDQPGAPGDLGARAPGARLPDGIQQRVDEAYRTFAPERQRRRQRSKHRRNSPALARGSKQPISGLAAAGPDLRGVAYQPRIEPSRGLPS